MALIKCEECGKEISDKAKACPFCGCPIEKENPASQDQEPQAEETPNDHESETISFDAKPEKSKRIKIIASSLAFVVLLGVAAFAFWTVKNIEQQKQIRNEYVSNLNGVSIAMFVGASDAESLCNLTYNVWNNSILEESNSETDEYTKNQRGVFYDDFNLAIADLFDSAPTVKAVADIKKNQESVSELIKKLNNPPEEFEKQYETLIDLYSAYQKLTNLAISPQGNLQTYGQNKNDYISEFLEYYRKLDILMPELEEINETNSDVSQTV